jgi:hypothetical protein
LDKTRRSGLAFDVRPKRFTGINLSDTTPNRAALDRLIGGTEIDRLGEE